MWSRKFTDFDQDFVGYNLDDNWECLSLYKLEGNKHLCRCQWWWVKAQYNNVVAANGQKYYWHFVGPEFMAIRWIQHFNITQLILEETVIA
jgi:hypothetical protein